MIIGDFVTRFHTVFPGEMLIQFVFQSLEALLQFLFVLGGNGAVTLGLELTEGVERLL
jgi:hypothetical protein